MISLLRIENFTLVDYLELDLGAKLNVLTGETGAGKSIILDAIDIALGGKVNHRLIRQGTQQALIEATFHIDHLTLEWLKQQEIDPLEDGTIVCSRELTLTETSLRSRCRVNGILVNIPLMNQLREHLVEITAQGQTVQLMDSANQRDLLDLYGGESLLKQRQVIADAYEVAKNVKQALEKRRQSEQQRLQRLDLLEYQLKELNEAQLNDPEELELLEQERDRLSHVVELQQLSYQAYQLLYQNDNGEMAAADLLGQTESLLTNMVDYDQEIEPILEMVRNALTQVVEAGHQINGYGDSLEADPQRLSEVEERIIELKRICRKYGPSLGEAVAYYEKLQQELDELTDSGQSIEKLEEDYKIAQDQLNQTCAELTQLRQEAATQLETELVKQLKPLAMDKVIFVCKTNPIPPSVTGADQVIFYFSPNPGEKIQPLSSTASGGEMSRFLLALKSCFSQTDDHSQTLIFDEIDAGVSGKVAQAIAEKLHQLSEKHQVLCVTHQPLVAAMADVHFRVEKEMVEDYPVINQNHNGQSLFPEIRTVVRVRQLDNPQTRREELALLSSGHSAQDAIAFAESLLTKATAYRSAKKSH